MCDFVLCATPEQQKSLDAPLSVQNLAGLYAADFLGDQTYINRWIVKWLQSNDVDPDTLPLCIEESIRCYPENKATYDAYIKHAIVRQQYSYLQKHYLWFEGVWHWNCVDFFVIHDDVFDLLWEKHPVPAELLDFVCAGRNLHAWTKMINEYGPTAGLASAIEQKWPSGVKLCLDYGADVHSRDFICTAMKHADIFRMVSDCNPPATDKAWQQFKFRRSFGAIPDEPLVEQWFYTQGYTLS